MIINGVSACWSGLTYQEAIHNLNAGTIEPLLGVLAVKDVQLCPQHKNILTKELVTELLKDYPHIQFRLHSDVRVPKKIGYTIDLIDFNEKNLWYFEYLSELSRMLNAPLYSLHAGARGSFKLDNLIEKYYLLEEMFSCPIAVEGHYPFKGDHWLVSSWKEYETIYKEGLNYALDLSHLNIVAKREGWNWNLTQEMITSKQCKEIHISFNEGNMDSHIVSRDTYNDLWSKWKDLIKLAPQDCAIFSEGNQVLELRHQSRI